MLQRQNPEDFVVSSGKQYTIKFFINLVAKKLKLKIKWKGKGLLEKAYNEKGQSIIECRKRYFRPLEVDSLLGDSTKAKKLLNWKPSHDINSLVDEMIAFELNELDEKKL